MKGTELLAAAKPYLLVIFLQFAMAGMFAIAKFAMNKGMDQHVYVVYRNLFASVSIAPFALLLERNRRPKMTIPILVKIMVLGLLEPVIDQNLYYTGMKYTSATFTTAMTNVLPAFAFLLAWIFRLEKVNVRRVHSQAKILGTVVTVAGAMLMTLVKGPVIGLPWDKSSSDEGQGNSIDAAAASDPIKGALMIVSGCFCWASFVVLQAITLKSYPVELSLTALICLAGAVEGSIFAIAWERGIIATSWTLHFDSILLIIIYSGVICSGLFYYIQGKVMQTHGPVFITAFSPLTMVIVAILGSFFLHEITYLGRLIGALVIVVGLYIVLWGKHKDHTPSNGEKEPVPSVNDDIDEHTKEKPVSSNGSAEKNSFVAADSTKLRPNDEVV